MSTSKRIGCYALGIAIGLMPFGNWQAQARAVVREEQTVFVGDKQEVWRLEWVSSTSQVCAPEDESEAWKSCPCWGFEYSEAGILDLVRITNGKEIERMHLTPLFKEESEWCPDSSAEGKAILQKYPRKGSDPKGGVSPQEHAAEVRRRPIKKVMLLADYDHDGLATEFVLQVQAGPCGHQQSVVVGLSKRNPHLHAFASIEEPNKPLIMESPEEWERIRKASKSVHIILWSCGDHGSDYEKSVMIWHDIKGLHAKYKERKCTDTDPQSWVTSGLTTPFSGRGSGVAEIEKRCAFCFALPASADGRR